MGKPPKYSAYRRPFRPPFAHSYGQGSLLTSGSRRRGWNSPGPWTAEFNHTRSFQESCANEPALVNGESRLQQTTVAAAARITQLAMQIRTVANVAVMTFATTVSLHAQRGALSVSGQPDVPFAEVLKPTGHSNLDALRNLAAKVSIDELVAKWLALLSAVNDTYPDDTTLCCGARRSCDEVISNDKLHDRSQIAGWAIQVISFATEDAATELRPLLNELRLVR